MTEETNKENTKENNGDGKVCPTCGRPHKDISKIKHMAVGAVIGWAVGLTFVYFWFGLEAGLLSFMAVVHQISGTILGALGGLVVVAIRK